MRPAPGTVLPPNPVLFVFVPSNLDGFLELPELFVMRDDAGRELVTDVQVLPGSTDQAVVRVAPRASAGVTVKFASGMISDSNEGWPVRRGVASAGEDFRVDARPDDISSWACSFTSYKVFQTSVTAPAYLVEFAADEAALRRGEAQRVVVEGSKAGLQLGHSSCGGWNIDWPAPRVALRVSALLSTGRVLRSERVFVVDRSPEWEEIPRR